MDRSGYHLKPYPGGRFACCRHHSVTAPQKIEGLKFEPCLRVVLPRAGREDDGYMGVAVAFSMRLPCVCQEQRLGAG